MYTCGNQIPSCLAQLRACLSPTTSQPSRPSVVFRTGPPEPPLFARRLPQRGLVCADMLLVAPRCPTPRLRCPLPFRRRQYAAAFLRLTDAARRTHDAAGRQNAGTCSRPWRLAPNSARVHADIPPTLLWRSPPGAPAPRPPQPPWLCALLVILVFSSQAPPLQCSTRHRAVLASDHPYPVRLPRQCNPSKPMHAYNAHTQAVDPPQDAGEAV